VIELETREEAFVEAIAVFPESFHSRPGIRAEAERRLQTKSLGYDVLVENMRRKGAGPGIQTPPIPVSAALPPDKDLIRAICPVCEATTRILEGQTVTCEYCKEGTYISVKEWEDIQGLHEKMSKYEKEEHYEKIKKAEEANAEEPVAHHENWHQAEIPDTGQTVEVELQLFKGEEGMGTETAGGTDAHLRGPGDHDRDPTAGRSSAEKSGRGNRQGKGTGRGRSDEKSGRQTGKKSSHFQRPPGTKRDRNLID